MKKSSKFLALGLAGTMILSMSATVFAAETGLGSDTGKQAARTFTVGDEVPPDASVDVDIQGMVIDSWAIDTSEGTNPVDTTDPSSDASMGGEDTYGNAYLTITAPTRIRFESVGTRNAVLAAGTGQITNQSYYQPNPVTEGDSIPRPKKVEMTVTTSDVNSGQDQFSVNAESLDTSKYEANIKGLSIAFMGLRGSDASIAYANNLNQKYELNPGKVATDKKTVVPSRAFITFIGDNEGGTTVNAEFAPGYSGSTPLNAASKLNLAFHYVK